MVDGETVAAAEAERFSRRKHGKTPVAFSTWELPEQAIRWCLDAAGLTPSDLDAVAYSYDPGLCRPVGNDITADNWEGLRTLYAKRAPLFLKTVLEGWEGDEHRLRRTVALPPERQRPLRDAVARAEHDMTHHARVEQLQDAVTFEVWTHSLDRVTDMDVELARRIDAAVAAVGSHG